MSGKWCAVRTVHAGMPSASRFFGREARPLFNPKPIFTPFSVPKNGELP
jgi:hypothetical protein